MNAYVNDNLFCVSLKYYFFTLSAHSWHLRYFSSKKLNKKKNTFLFKTAVWHIWQQVWGMCSQRQNTAHKPEKHTHTSKALLHFVFLNNMQAIGTPLSVQFHNTLCYLPSIKYDRHNFNKNCWYNRWFEWSGEAKWKCFSHTLFAGHQDYSNLKRHFNNISCLSWWSKNKEKAKTIMMEVNERWVPDIWIFFG